MSDLIDRQQAIDAFNTSLNELVIGGEENAKTVENYLNRVIEKIKSLPSAQPKKGKWKRTYLDHEAMGERPSILYCSECGQCIAYTTNYCPNCGAKMQEE